LSKTVEANNHSNFLDFAARHCR